MDTNQTLATDLYQITMAQSYWKSGKADQRACFHMYFRNRPFDGGYAIACGMVQLADMIESFRFAREDIDYLATIEAPGGGRLFERSFLDYLENLKLDVDLDAVEEGMIVFENEPLVRVVGPILQCQLLETALLNVVGFQTLIATKAMRVCLAARGRPVAEFGLRRAQGLGGLWASRAAVVGGCASTSNVLAGKKFGLPVSGTHAHSWVMAFSNEIEAFREYARTFPNNCILLIDTYDVVSGLENAIVVGKEMQERGAVLQGIRIDSGDLARLSKMARDRLDASGLTDCAIVLSGDLDEYVIESLLAQRACVDSFGVGAKLATAFEQPTLGGVYKLSAIQNDLTSPWEYRMKLTAQTAKLSFPGVLGVRRYVHEDGLLAGDMVYDMNQPINQDEVIVDPRNPLRSKKLAGRHASELLKPLVRSGRIVFDRGYRDAMLARSRALSHMDSLDESQKRLVNPHTYPVGLERDLADRRRELARRLRNG